MDKLQAKLPIGYTDGTPVLVAFSGGADSALLVHLLHRAGVKLYAVHVHHGIRGKDADADLDFCRKTCKDLKIPLFAVRINAPALAKKSGESIETAAREARYRHFARLMKAHGIPLLATAHHADDNLETLLFRLARGTGTAGMRGIPHYAILPGTQKKDGLYLCRPLLHMTKKEILQACASMRVEYVTDATNACNDYARNRIRNRIVPELETLFPHPQAAAARLCRAVAEDCDALDGMADALYTAHATNGSLPLDVLKAQPAALSKRLITQLYADFATQYAPAQTHMAEAVHLDAIYTRICDNAPGSISLPGEIAAVIDRGTLRMTKNAPIECAPYLVPLQHGFCQIPEAGVAIMAYFPQKPKTDTNIDTNVYNLYTELQVRFDTIVGRLFLRPIAQGDVILQGGMHKKIRKLYGQSGVSLSLRQRLPLLCDDLGVLAVPGICLRDGCAVRTGDNALTLRIYLLDS